MSDFEHEIIGDGLTSRMDVKDLYFKGTIYVDFFGMDKVLFTMTARSTILDQFGVATYSF